MPVNLNLLPPELSVSKSLSSFLKTVRALGVIATIAFLIFGVFIIAFFIVNKLALDNVNTKVSALKNQVSAQEQSEQQIVLLKDRLGKITSIQSLPNSLPSLNTMDPIFTNSSGSAVIDKMLIDPTGVNLSLNIKTNSSLTSLLTLIRNPDVFSAVNLTSFNLDPINGYATTLQMVKK